MKTHAFPRDRGEDIEKAMREQLSRDGEGKKKRWRQREGKLNVISGILAPSF